MQKTNIRKQLQQLRNQISESGLLHKQAKDIIEALERHPRFRDANHILLFHSLPDEVDTHDLIERYRRVKTILLPTVVGNQLELHVCGEDTPMKKGSFGIMESLGRIVPPSEYGSIDLAVIPGVAFDREGNRLGRGKGYYDRLLPLLTCHTIGLCYPFQVVNQVPHESHDIPVKEILTIGIPDHTEKTRGLKQLED